MKEFKEGVFKALGLLTGFVIFNEVYDWVRDQLKDSKKQEEYQKDEEVADSTETTE